MQRLVAVLARLPARLRRAGPALLGAVALLAVLSLAGAPARAQVVAIEQALSVEGGGPSPPAGAALQAVALPDDWSRSRPGSGGPMWYRASFALGATPAPHQAFGLQSAHVCALVAVRLNGHSVYGGVSGAPDAICGHPQLVVLPAVLLRAGTNVVDVQVGGHPLGRVASRHRAGALSALQVGPLAEMQALQHRQLLLQVDLRQALGAALLLTGGFMFVLGFVNRRESQLAYFGVVSVTWALLDAPLWLREWPLPQPLAELAMAALPALLTHAAVQFLLRGVRWRQRWIDVALPAQTLLVPLSLALAGSERLYPWLQGWTVLLALEAMAAALFHLHRQWAERSSSFWVMGSLLALLSCAGAVEAVARDQAVPSPALLLARLLVPLALVLVGLRLVQQHGQALRSAEDGKARLEQRVREATAEIERNYRQLSELKIEQVTERERKRIAADLHDDLGAKLLTIVHTSESDRISTLAREALEEMRLSVRGLTGRPVRLADALGDWRAEVVSRLAQAGIEADWSAPEDLPQTLSARAYVQTTRILREATSNIIKHSAASYCSVRCKVADGDFQLVVQDNGEGIVSEPDGRLDRGHGMATMKHRAKQLQGQCLVESGPGFGTVIRLTLPLDRALAGA